MPGFARPAQEAAASAPVPGRVSFSTKGGGSDATKRSLRMAEGIFTSVRPMMLPARQASVPSGKVRSLSARSSARQTV